MNEEPAEARARAPSDADTPALPRARIRRALLDHYDRHARDLPWRADTDPYRVLVSEVMLQQTRVETVKGYYDRWLDRFPTIDDLAAADEDEVLKAWEGLGYYRRARSLHAAARVVREAHRGRVPDSYASLRELPGVGAYTAGAVASIAFGIPVSAVDGNVRRVLARLFDEPSPAPAWLRARADELVDAERPGDWNQALMELGATVCTPTSPDCARCPLRGECVARAAGTQGERPVRAARRPVPSADFALAVVHESGRVLLEKRPVSGLLGGMWAFPERRLGGSAGDGSEGRGEVTGEEPSRSVGRSEAIDLVRALGLEPGAPPEPLPPCRHRFTHLEARYLPWSIEVSGGAETEGRAEGGTGPGGAADLAWIDPAEPGSRALPRAQQVVLASWIEARGG